VKAERFFTPEESALLALLPSDSDALRSSGEDQVQRHHKLSQLRVGVLKQEKLRT
jgi:hypothetical protein